MLNDHSGRHLHLAAFWFPPAGHLGGWRMPDAVPESDMEFRHYVRLAELAEQGRLDALFFQDIVGVPSSLALDAPDHDGTLSIRTTALEPLTLLPALAAVTRHVGLVATATTTFNEPYHLARKFASLDHISGGRAGWNLVTSQTDDEAHNFGTEKLVDHALRYERASEFFDVMTGLWDSWEDDAILRDKASGTYADIKKLHVLRHKGRFFSVRGPLNVARPPQGWPVIAQAGSSEPGRELAARTADIVFSAQNNIESAQAFYADLKGRTRRFGRTPDDIKVLPGIKPVVGRSLSEAEEINAQLQSLIPADLAMNSLMRLSGGLDLRQYPLDGPLPELPPSNLGTSRQKILIDAARQEGLTIRQLAQRHAESSGHLSVVGTAAMIADVMEEWLHADAADGFVIRFSHFPKPIEDFVTLVVPELQRRGLFRRDYTGRTLRDHLGLKRPANQFSTA